MRSRWTCPSWVSPMARGEYRLLEIPICEYAKRGSPWPHITARVFMHEVDVCVNGGYALRRYLGGPGGENRLFEDPILRIHNARQSEAASHSARVSKHEMVICGHGGHIYHANFRGPGGEYRLLKVPFLRIRETRQSAAASRSVRVYKHQGGVKLSGICI